MIDKALIEECKKGNSQAFEKLIDSYSQKAFRTAFFITRRRDLAEDLVQETFFKCYRDLPKLKSIEAFNTWFYKILIHMCWRASSKERLNISLDETGYTEKKAEAVISSQKEDLLQSLEKKEENKQLYDSINSLKPVLRTAVILFYFNGLSLKEISKIQGCFVGTVKSRLNTARKKLKAALDFTDEEQPIKNHIKKGAFLHE